MLFDFSNAYIAEINRICAMSAWDDLIANTKHFHVGGFRVDTLTKLAIDTHDNVIAEPVIQRMQKYFNEFSATDELTLTIEFEANTDIIVLKNEILRLKAEF